MVIADSTILQFPLALLGTVWINGAMDSLPPKVLPTLKELENASTASLRAFCVDILGFEPPPRCSTDFMRGNIAWALQARQQGHKPTTLRKRHLKATNGATVRHKVSYMPGSRLVREWQGNTYEVTILEKGYRWQDRQYRSLSRIAQEITGTKWSGPRFFGLDKAAS